MDRGKLTLAWWGVATAFFYIYFAAFAALAYGTVNARIGLGMTVMKKGNVVVVPTLKGPEVFIAGTEPGAKG